MYAEEKSGDQISFVQFRNETAKVCVYPTEGGFAIDGCDEWTFWADNFHVEKWHVIITFFFKSETHVGMTGVQVGEKLMDVFFAFK